MPEPSPIDWEAFYRSYRKPGYIKGFEILHKIGAGSFGLVFKARKQSIGRDYAIKFLKVDDETVRDTILRELASVKLFAQVDHPNLVSIEDRGEVDGIPYIVMGYAGAETLRSVMAEGSVARGQAMRLFVQIARGVAALHDHALVHFDLKPANVFLAGDLVRVGDYGLSRLVTQSRNSLSVGRGTPYYMAPELLQRRGDHRSDIYSLGVLLYELLTGDVPFRGSSEWEILHKHETETPTLPDTLAAPERAVIARCLAKDPAQRFDHTGELLAALQPAPPAPVPAVAPPPRRRPRAAALIATVLAFAAVAGLFSVKRFTAPPHVEAASWYRAGPRRAAAPIGWDRRFDRLATTHLVRLARRVADSRVDDALRAVLHELNREMRGQVDDRVPSPALAHLLDTLSADIDDLLDDLELRDLGLDGWADQMDARLGR